MGIERALQTSEIPSLDKMISNALYAWDMAQADKVNFEYGLSWFDREHDNSVLAKADLFGSHGIQLSVQQMTDVIAMVSSGRYWSTNIIDAKHTIVAWAIGDNDEQRKEYLASCNVSRRFGWPMFVRTWRYLEGDYAFTFRKSPKQFSFSDNLQHSSLSPLVTVDQHEAHILIGEFLAPLGSLGVSYPQYLRLQSAVYNAATIVGVNHVRFQSATWQWRIAMTQPSKLHNA